MKQILLILVLFAFGCSRQLKYSEYSKKNQYWHNKGPMKARPNPKRLL